MRTIKKVTVGDLKEVLKEVPDDTLIIMAIDPEGNAFRPLEDHSLDYNYDEKNEDITEDEVEGPMGTFTEPCIVLWPK